jgi:CxxC-x17-CxxC domain-containing protein
MSFQSKSIHCSNCLAIFTVNSEKQEFLQAWGYTNDLKLCPSCLRARKLERYGTGNYGHSMPHQMFRAICADCGRNTEVPFEPRRGRRVYCSECYSKVRVKR